MYRRGRGYHHGTGWRNHKGASSVTFNVANLIDRRYTQQELTQIENDTSNNPMTHEEQLSLLHPPTSSQSMPPQEFAQDKRFFCERCFRGYNSQHYYDMHLKNHIKCTAEDCKFEALPRVVAKHYMTMHSMVMNSPSVAGNDAWIKARKRMYPSQHTIEEKLEHEQAKISRGEIVDVHDRSGKIKFRTMKHYESPGSTANTHNKRSDARPKRHQIIENSTTFVARLLQTQIRYERNVILQCIRHLINKTSLVRDQNVTKNTENSQLSLGDSGT